MSVRFVRLELYFNVGFRISNITHLNKPQIDLINKRINIQTSDNKSKKVISQKLSKRALEIIMKYYNNADFYLFTHTKDKYKGKPIKNISKSWKTAAKAIGMPIDEKGNVISKPHDGRFSFGTKVYNATKDLLITQKALHHEDDKTTKLYIDIPDDNVDNVIVNLNN